MRKSKKIYIYFNTKIKNISDAYKEKKRKNYYYERKNLLNHLINRSIKKLKNVCLKN